MIKIVISCTLIQHTYTCLFLILFWNYFYKNSSESLGRVEINKYVEATQLSSTLGLL